MYRLRIIDVETGRAMWEPSLQTGRPMEYADRADAEARADNLAEWDDARGELRRYEVVDADTGDGREKRHPVSVSMTAAELAELDAWANGHGVSRSRAVTALVSRALAAERDGAPAAETGR